MTTLQNTPADAAGHEIVVTRQFNVPRQAVWSAWTEPDQVARWFGPKCFGARVEALDLRPGGRWRYVMIGPDGTEYPSHGVFREVETGRRIVTSDEFGEGMEQMVPDLPQGIVVTTLFEDQAGGTKVTVRMAHPTEEDRRRHEAMGVIPGWQSTFDCLEEHLATVQG